MREPKPLSTPGFLFSILILAIGFLVFSWIRPFPVSQEEWSYVANFKSVVEEGGFLSPVEPFVFLILRFFKQIFGLNYIPAYLALAGLIYSLFLHLFLLLLRREAWRRNHYLFVYLAAYLPFSYGFPTSYLAETLCLVFLLLIFLTFRMEKMTDLLVFPGLTILAFLSSIQMFLLGFTFFVLFSGIRGSRKAAQKTSVFYKKKNIPFLFVMGYLVGFCLVLGLFSGYQIFGPSSVSFLFKTWWTYIAAIVFPLLVLGIGHVLLKTERELNTMAASIVLLLLITGSLYFIFRNFGKETKEPWEQQSIRLTKAFGQALILKSDPIYLPKEFSHAFYFQTGSKTRYWQEPITERSFLYAQGVWSQDIQALQKTTVYKKNARSSVIIPLGEEDVLVSKGFLSKLGNDKNVSFFVKKVQESQDNLYSMLKFDGFLFALQKRFGYRSFYREN